MPQMKSYVIPKSNPLNHQKYCPETIEGGITIKHFDWIHVQSRLGGPHYAHHLTLYPDVRL
jgi:hypothetical protein